MHVQGRNAADDIGNFIDLEFIERVTAYGRHRYRCFLKRFILLTRCDDDDVAAGFIFDQILR